jgi:predicted PurR-regulated permease PerM
VPAGLDRAAGWAWRLIVIAAALALALVVLWYFKVIVLPAIVALTVAPALVPLANRLRGWGAGRAAPGIALVAGIAVIAALIAIVTASLAADYDELATNVRAGVEDVTDWLAGEPFNLSLERDRDLNESVRNAWGDASSYLVSGVRSGAAAITGLVLAVTLLYFILRDGAAFWRRALRAFSPATRTRLDHAGNSAWRVLGGFVRGTALIAAIDATLIGVGLWILGVPLPFALAVLVFLGAFIPFVGAALTGLVAVLVALAAGGLTTALLALALVAAVQFIEGTFLQPVIQSRTVDLHPVAILLAVAAGGSLFGILGAYLAVPVTAVVYAVAASLAGEPLTEEAPVAGSG